MLSALFKSLHTLLFLSLFSTAVFGQSSVEQLQSYMSQVRSGGFQPIPVAVLTDAASEQDLLNILTPLGTDSATRVRSKAYDLADRIAHKSEQKAIRQQCITFLIGGIRDMDSGISGQASRALTHFPKDHFTPTHLAALTDLLVPATPHLDVVMKLCAFLEVEATSQLKTLLTNTALSASERFAAQLALARLGDTPSQEAILAKLNNITINGDFIYDIVPELVYTKQRDIFDYLVSIIQSEEKNCYSANPDAETNILCGYRVMEYIAGAIIDYPLPIDEYGDLEVADYSESLKTVREWFDANPNYQLDKSVF